MRLCRLFGREFRHALINIIRQRWMSVSATLSVTVSLFLISIFIVLLINIRTITTGMGRELAIYVSLDKEVDAAQAKTIMQNVESLANVATATYQDEEEELNSLIASFGEEGAIFEEYRQDNPLRKTLTVRLIQSQKYEKILKQLQTLPGVHEVKYSRETADKIYNVFHALQVGAGLLSLVVAFIALALISNTIRITIVARRTEIEIMRLVGASNWFIRIPFLLEGLFIGLCGAFLSAVIALIGYHSIYEYIQSTEFRMITFALLGEIILPIWIILFSAGCLIGIVGSLLPMGRFLRK